MEMTESLPEVSRPMMAAEAGDSLGLIGSVINRRRFLGLTMGTVATGTFASLFGAVTASAEAYPHKKITICHKPGRNQETITVNCNAWPAHKAHGDYRGPCRDR